MIDDSVESQILVIRAILEERDKRYEEKFNAQESAVIIALGAAEKASDKSERDIVKWQQGANEWRGAMVDREDSFISIDQFKSLEKAVDALAEDFKVSTAKRQGATQLWSAILAAVVVIATVIGVGLVLL